MILIKSLYICYFLTILPHPMQSYQPMFKNCTDVVKQGNGKDLDLYLAVASYESKFLDIISNGNHGVFQIKPKYWCNVPCDDLIKAGINALFFLGKRYKTRKKLLCHYNRGNLCDEKGLRYAKNVISKSIKIKRILNDFDRNGMIIYLTYLSSILSHFRCVLDTSSTCS